MISIYQLPPRFRVALFPDFSKIHSIPCSGIFGHFLFVGNIEDFVVIRTFFFAQQFRCNEA
jgi:hypothetical protein